MKILYDHQIFSEQKYGGISRYFAELFFSYQRNKNLDFSLGLRYSENFYINEIMDLEEPTLRFFLNKEYSELFHGFDFRGKWTLYNLLCEKPVLRRRNKRKSIELLKKSDFDIFHPTYYDPYFLRYLKGKPYVITVHDMIHERLKEFVHPKNPILLNKRTAINNANGIIAVSQSTKNDLIGLYGIASEKIDVIYHGSSKLNENHKISFNLPDKYLLYVGSRKNHKNFSFFVKSIIPLLESHKELFLVCIGTQFNKEELAELTELKVIDRVVSFTANDSEIAYAYHNALAFVFPSLYEGFGIPLLEAFSLGCPVICSDIQVFKEIAQDAALYFDPLNSFSINDIITNYIDNIKDLREDLVLKGKTRSKCFSWDKAAELTKNVYEKVLTTESEIRDPGKI